MLYGIVSYNATLFCMTCHDKIMYRIYDTILYYTITLTNKIRYFDKDKHN